jgi:hypothetical protein
MMANGQNDVVQVLLEKRAGLVAQKAEIDAKVAAMDLVIQEFGGGKFIAKQAKTNGNGSAVSESPEPNKSALADIPQRPGLKVLAREHIHELPEFYIKDDLQKLLLRLAPDMTEINENTLGGVARNLVKHGLALVHQPAIGKNPQIYARIKREGDI